MNRKNSVFKNSSDDLLSKKKPLKKSAIIQVSEVEQTVKKMANKGKEPTSKASVTLPKSLYKEMKKRAIELDLTVTEYFKNLLIEDLKNT